MNRIDVMKTDIEYLLAKIIIAVDGDNALGAAQLAEKIVNEMINRLTKSQLERLAEARSKAIEAAEKNQFNPDWNAINLLSEENLALHRRIAEMEAKLKERNT
jgi:ubiquinone biosynthesis protein UbiJ